MAMADKYLYEGERIIATLPAGGFLGDREMAATDTRIICAQPGMFYDVRYDSLSSIGNGSIYEPVWAIGSFAFTALAIAFAWMASLVPQSLPFGPFSIGLSGLVSLVGLPAVICGAFAVAAAAIFLFTTRQGIILRMPGGTFVFGYGRGRDDEAVAFLKTLRAGGGHREMNT